MTTGQLIIVCLTVLLLAGLATIVAVTRAAAGDFDPVELDGHAPVPGSRVVVHKIDGQALQGEFAGLDASGVKLEQVELLADGVTRSVAGAWYIGAERIDSLQEL